VRGSGGSRLGPQTTLCAPKPRRRKDKGPWRRPRALEPLHEGRDPFHRVHACPKPFHTKVDGVEPVPTRRGLFMERSQRSEVRGQGGAGSREALRPSPLRSPHTSPLSSLLGLADFTCLDSRFADKHISVAEWLARCLRGLRGAPQVFPRVGSDCPTCERLKSCIRQESADELSGFCPSASRTPLRAGGMNCIIGRLREEVGGGEGRAPLPITRPCFRA